MTPVKMEDEMQFIRPPHDLNMPDNFCTVYPCLHIQGCAIYAGV
jgi:hypothetical protein